MFELEPESPELMAYYRANLEEHRKIAGGCRIPPFTKDLRRDLMAFLPDNESIQLVEVVTRMGDFCNTADLISMRRSVSRQLKVRSVNMPRGKRTAPGLREFVAHVAPVLLSLGLPLATGGRSKLVQALQMIAYELDLPGDPRDELRRLRKIQVSNAERDSRLAAELVASALKHFAPLR